MNILLSFVCMIMGLIIYFVARSNVKKYNYKGIDKLQEYLGVVDLILLTMFFALQVFY